jgi:hypothetical protein
MAQVWRARDRRTGLTVAVKFLSPAEDVHRQLDTREKQEDIRVLLLRFQQETLLLSRLDNIGIPRLYDHGKHRNVPFLVMELIEGMPLKQFLDLRRPLPLGSGVAVAVQIADALACAHRLPVVHRDLKPQNVMLAYSGLVKLVDFGIAKQLGADVPSYTKYGTTLGSLGYQAPEQLHWGPVTPKTDVYALGCVCYELFTGRAPFIGSESKPLQDQHLNDLPAPPIVFAPHLPDDLDNLVVRMLAKDPDERPDMTEISTTLRLHLPSVGAPAPVPRLHPDPTRLFREPEAVHQERVAESRAAVADEPSPGSDWLSVREVESDCQEAEQELAVGSPATAVDRLAGIAGAARKEWGPARPLVRKVHRLAAEGLRQIGDHGRAAPLYQQLADDQLRSRDPRDREAAVVWRLRAAECRLPFGEGASALDALHEGARAAASTLPEGLAAEVRAVCRELEARLVALGYREQVQRLLERLERELG